MVRFFKLCGKKCHMSNRHCSYKQLLVLCTTGIVSTIAILLLSMANKEEPPFEPLLSNCEIPGDQNPTVVEGEPVPTNLDYLKVEKHSKEWELPVVGQFNPFNFQGLQNMGCCAGKMFSGLTDYMIPRLLSNKRYVLFVSRKAVAPDGTEFEETEQFEFAKMDEANNFAQRHLPLGATWEIKEMQTQQSSRSNY